MNRERLTIMIEIAVMAGLALVLSFVKFGALWAMGGSISLVMVPIFLLAFRRGLKVGLLTGLLVGLLGLVTGPTIVHPVQLVLDYPLAYMVLGFAGIFAAKQAVPKLSYIVLGLVLATVLRFLSHFASGVIWFGQYAPDGMNPSVYSFLYNLSYLFPEMLITLAIILFLARSYSQFFKAGKTSTVLSS
ncbi:energy-coupled thiamine transporter ThiT [Alkalihalophilus pseudofirmus]|uniref:Energy-coupled thiamine transporter ThiT n=1 Tax=Alkalihalophilus pseudofirmus TaxID=79885 RepID=A0AAJ2NQ95_ALKPS|nr:energy-coupled thiamine transporter ThiT [Alkalihalophilus pseudofirmus]MDV2886625.1 energy-coupled thiamine transporter ThiT [Alkalihalophilus pseudofirmus]